MKIVVLGAGMVGSAIAKDLALDSEFSVAAADMDRRHLARLEAEAPVKGIQADLRDEKTVAAIVSDQDFVISAVPGFMGFDTLRRIIDAGKNVVDISFFGEDPFPLDEAAKSKGVTAVVDCGVAPGLCNIMAGHASGRLDATDRYVCYVGGLPIVRQWPFEYKAVFSPLDVLEEYTRPARFVEYGREIVRPALSEVELIDFPGVGTLEAFNTDGLRSLIKTMKIPFMREKTMRYPGHAELLRIFRESGFFGVEPIEIEGKTVRPIALTSKLLFDQWRLGEGEKDFTVMQVIVEGRKAEKQLRHTYNLLDRYDEKTRTTSMARTTGYTCSIVARQVIRGLFSRKGICPPEYVGMTNGCWENLLAEYAKRDITVTESIAR
jgi:saccharopine dehydrogenase-like NADP-dependent oxidoreductase